MSQSNSASATDSPYRRDAWWGESDDDEQPSNEATDAREDPNNPIRYLAHSLLRSDTDALCATTLHDAPYAGGRLAELVAWLVDDECIDGHGEAMHHSNREVELSEPCFYVPTESSAAFGERELTQQRHRARVNEETGYITGGETTAVVLQDRPTSEFLDTVETYLEMVRQRMAEDDSLWLSEEDLQDARELAERRKRAGDSSDLEVMEAVVRRVRRGRTQ